MFRFTIRDVLWLTVVVGLGVAWWADHIEAAKQLELQRAWRSLEISGSRHMQRALHSVAPTPGRPSAPAGSRGGGLPWRPALASG
jgi:hypothetical protein